MERISIPAAKPAPVAKQAADLVIDAIREAGCDPRAVYAVPLARDCAIAWRNGEYTRADFIRAMRNMAILNPKLKANDRNL